MPKSGLFITELKSKSSINIPAEIVNSLDLDTGDKVEITIKKIVSSRLSIQISKNPLIKLLEIHNDPEKK